VMDPLDVFRKDRWPAAIAGQSRMNFPQRPAMPRAGVFDAPGRSDLRHDAGGRFPSRLNARTV
jgi:hypothetical protein